MKLSLEVQQTPVEKTPLEAVTIVSKAINKLLRGERLDNSTEVMDALHIVFKVCRDKQLETV